MKYQIYLITNKINNKKYIGQTTISRRGYIRRFEEHCYQSKHLEKNHNDSLLHRAIAKYGRENFILELIEDNISEEDIDTRESYWIEYYNTYSLNDKGYNMTFGGQGVHGYHHSLETKDKMSKASIKYWENLKLDEEAYKEVCDMRSRNLKGKLKSDETKAKLSKSAKERFKHCPGTFKGKKHKQYSKDLIAIANGCPVGMYSVEAGELIAKFTSAMEATRYLIKNNKTKNKYANARILEICNGNGKTAYGYIWKYL